MSDPHADDSDASAEHRATSGDADANHAAHVVVEVTRTGGFAGITRTWRAEAAHDAVPEWIELIDRCPWEDSGQRSSASSPRTADRFAWDIRACTPDADRSAAIDDSALTGAWRDLVDQVRATGSAL